MKPALAGLLGALALANAGADAAPVKPAPPPPPFAGVYQPQGVDEIGLWRQDDESERALANSALVIRDEALTKYVRSVLCSAVGADRCNSVRVYIMRVPEFNATMSPNGTMRIFSGLLLRMRSEAELAAVLGHEFGHFEKRHTLARHKAQRSGTDILAWAAVLTSMSGSIGAYQSFDSLQMTIWGSLYRFTRDNEREADIVGLGYLNASSLRPQAASRVWRNLIAEFEASATARGESKPRFDRVAFFASHPPEAERATYLAELAAPDGAARDEGVERYRQAMAAWMPTFLDDQIRLNDFGGSEYLINSLAENGWTAPLWRARGDLYRARGAQRDLVHAADFYGKAIALDPSIPEAHRGLGLSLLKTGRGGEGLVALRRYLELKPDASDASMIRMTLASMEGRQ